MNAKPTKRVQYFGHHDLPQEQQDALRKAVRLERIPVAYKLIAMRYLCWLAAQAMKAAWIEDALSLLPPLAFLVLSDLLVGQPRAIRMDITGLSESVTWWLLHRCYVGRLPDLLTLRWV